MRLNIKLLIVLCLLTAGCESIRFAPGETQKQNAWLHSRTTMIAAQQARQENTSEKLQVLTDISQLQSRAFVAYYGLPKQYPPAETAEDVLSQSNFALTRGALRDSSVRPDGWEMADSAMEFGIGIFALLGGAYGIKAAQFLKMAKAKSKALKEVVEGNELFKKTNSAAAETFKQAHKIQSPQTRQIVAEMKT